MKAWLKIFLPIAAIIVAVFALYARIESRQSVARLVEAEQVRLRMAEQRLNDTFSDSIIDLRVISGLPAVKDFIAGDEAGRSRIESLLSSFVREDWTYDQLRIIDAQGQERVRVNRSPDGATVVPPGAMQDKSSRDYVVESLKLLPGQIFVSRMELNSEHGVVDVPHRPVLRLAMRLGSASAASDYVLVANLRGAVVLKGLQEFITASEGEVWLLDRDGYWLMHPDLRTDALDGYATLGQSRWAAWRRKQHLDDRLPSSFANVLEDVVAFADPAISAAAESHEWNPHARRWRRLQL